ncbi:MAG: hypothetical protein ACI9VS_004534, partial [Candidatus Binatia bacterium]
KERCVWRVRRFCFFARWGDNPKLALTSSNLQQIDRANE